MKGSGRWMTRIGCMWMRRRSESIPDDSTSHLLAQMRLSQKSDQHPLGTRMKWKEDHQSTRASRVLGRGTQICIGRDWLSRTTSSGRRPNAPSDQ
jgi:hypothetical protein